MLLSLLYQFPTWLQRLYSGVTWRKDPSSKVVYLTFDDGPIPEVTLPVLDILTQHQVQATFFMVADNAEQHPDIVQQVRAAGHAIGNHTFHHLKGFQLPTKQYIQDIEAANQVLHTTLFRPPHGRMRYAQKKALLQAGYHIYLWDVLTHDYNPRYSVTKMLRIIKRYTRNGSIIVLHDSLKSKDRMLQLLPQLITYLRAEGYEFRSL